MSIISNATTSYRKMKAELRQRTEGDFTLLSQDEADALSLARWREYPAWARYEPIVESTVPEIIYDAIHGDGPAASCSYETLRRAALDYLEIGTRDDWSCP